MADLIDRQAVIDLLKKSTSRDIEEVVVTEKNIKLIMDMPKAYDVDAVVKQLEEEKGKFEGIYTDYAEGLVDAYEHAISIVRKGGVE